MKREDLVTELADLVPFKLSIERGKSRGKVTKCITGTVDEMLAALGLYREIPVKAKSR